MRVSAIISTYNAANLIRGCLEDLLNQTLYQKGELEIVVIDSGSLEKEGEIVLEFQKEKPRIEYLRTEARESIYQAWNRGIRMAKGRYLTNANTDDRHDCDSLEKLADALDDNDEAVIAYGDCRMTGSCEKQFQTSDFPNREFFAPSLLLYNLFGYQPMWKSSLHSKIGYFNEDLKKASDYDFGLRAATAGKAVYVKEAFGTIYWGEDTQTLTDSTMIREINQIKEHWLGEEQIFSLYSREDVPVDAPSEQAMAYHDLGNRFLCFFPQWKGGQPESDPDKSILFFKRSLDKKYSWEAANNLAVALFCQGEPKPAAVYLNQMETEDSNDIVSQNLKEMNGFLLGQIYEPKLILTAPPLPVKREDEMSFSNNAIFQDYESHYTNSGYQYYEISISALWDSFVGRLSDQQWKALELQQYSGKTLIYGSGTRGQIFLNQVQGKGIQVAGFIDQNEDSSDSQIVPTLKPSSIESSDLRRSIVIVMTGKAHWNSINSNLKELLKPENIWFPDHGY
ncbi:glycosyltransferase [Opitutales bacterium]|nr:glycosyltransferase [Opitutales bacterium]